MKIGLDFAYYNKCESNVKPAEQILDPSTTLNEIGTILLEKLENYGYEVINCSPIINDSTIDSIESALEIANSEPLDLFISITLNSFSNSAKHGSEIYVSSKKGLAYDKAKKIQNRLCTLGYNSKGIIEGNNLKLLNSLSCSSLIVQCFYSTNFWDCKRYNKEEMADVLFKAITKENTIAKSYKNISC